MKKLQVAALAVGMVVLAGCGQKAAENQPAAQKEANKVEEPALPGEGGVINSIKSAMGLGATMKCTYKSTDENGKTIEEMAYVNGEKFRTDVKAGNDVEHILYDGDTIYSWSEKEKKGMKMKESCTEELDKLSQNDSDAEDLPVIDVEEEQDEFDDAQDVKCEKASGIDFDAPSGVEFQDQCEMLKAFLKDDSTDQLMPKGLPGDIPGNIPSGIPLE